MNTFDTEDNVLIDALCRITKPSDMRSALQCILTRRELHDITSRIHIFEMLEQNFSQREISKQLGVGIATVTRGAQAHKSNEFSSFRQYLK